uniref:Probable molybdopterin-synthase adenylyltransferase n=1 Tax=Galaxaura rugosa TaxID=268570 RepID=A0A1G4NT54_9FLOR|nr:Molybdopterin biosynthesis protein [Galaxaura rugosa]SCW21840.1 Molybdopterin biosynthesis protein [Galaxaura rugosa]
MIKIHKNSLSKYEYQLYARHLILPEIQTQGQERLKEASILFIGVGGLASPAILYLAAAGLGHIGLVDNDEVEISNLQRQIIYQTNNIGYKKVNAAAKNIHKINPLCKISTYSEKLNIENGALIIKKYDIIIDSCDNFETRHIISEFCTKLHKVHIYGAIAAFKGQISVFNYQGGPNYKDIYPKLNKRLSYNNCQNNGVLGVLPGLIGTMQATEALKIILGIGHILNGSLLIYNALTMSYKRYKLRNRYISSKSNILTINHRKLYNRHQEIYISIIEIKNKILSNPDKLYIIDIRNYYEYTANHLKYAINIPFEKLRYQKNLEILRKRSYGKLIIIYCNSIYTSEIASNFLKNANISHKILVLKLT